MYNVEAITCNNAQYMSVLGTHHRHALHFVIINDVLASDPQAGGPQAGGF